MVNEVVRRLDSTPKKGAGWLYHAAQISKPCESGLAIGWPEYLLPVGSGLLTTGGWSGCLDVVMSNGEINRSWV